MANRDITDNLAMLRALRDLRDDLRAEIPGFLTLIWAIRVQAIVDDDVEENAEFLAACDQIEAALNTLWDAQDAFRTPTAKMLGRYASCADLSDEDRCLAAFNDKLVADSDEFEVRGFTKFSAWVAGGSNVGDGTAMVHNIDPAFGGDVSHVETKTLKCVKSYPEVDQAVFEVEGAQAGDYSYIEGGSSRGLGYPGPTAGVGSNAPGAGASIRQTGDEIASVGVEASQGNLVVDGGFEAATLDSNDVNWTLDSGAAAINTSSPIAGSNDLKFAADGQVSQDLSGKIFPGRIYGLEFRTKKSGTVSAGTTTVRLYDGATAHLSIAVTNSAASGTEKQPYATVRIPATAKCDSMTLQIIEASIAGGGTMEVDNIILRELDVVDGGQAFGVTDGLVGWKAQNDVFTGATTGGTDGTLQRQNNELFGRGFEADATATDWADS